ncbi:hypothetical protein VTI74DRAFT_2207 [Chaetomium olivicolor]
MVTFASNSPSKPCSEDQLMLLDFIDRLRLQEMNNYISLQQINVCGDQSSSKSSVLTPHTSASFFIVPHESGTDAERKALLVFRQELVERAKAEIGVTPYRRAVTKDILRGELTGPGRPHLTIVEIPGSSTPRPRTTQLPTLSLSRTSYARQPRCIILAVVTAKNDFANHVVLQLANSADSTGTRALGVIPKPDTLVPGGESETLYVSLVRNQEVEFRQGWAIVQNLNEDSPAEISARGYYQELIDSQGARLWTSWHLQPDGRGRSLPLTEGLLQDDAAVKKTSAEREQLVKQLEVLRNGLKTCKRFVGFKINGGE